MYYPERKLNRLKNYDYSWPGYYFVNICAKNGQGTLGNVQGERIILNKYGEIVKKQWVWLEKQYSYIKHDAWIIMPDHLHGIIIIKGVGNGRDRSLRKIKPLWEIIGAFKTTSSRLIHKSGLPQFQWQKSFYDHIIRNDHDLNRIREYIRNNPLKWKLEQEPQK